MSEDHEEEVVVDKGKWNIQSKFLIKVIILQFLIIKQFKGQRKEQSQDLEKVTDWSQEKEIDSSKAATVIFFHSTDFCAHFI